MGFPGGPLRASRTSSPIFVTANGSVPVPANATVMHALIVAGGGSGAAASNGAGTNAAAGGGGGGGVLYLRIKPRLIVGDFPSSTSRLSTVSLTIGSGGVAVAQTGGGFTSGNPGGSTTLALVDTAFSVTVTGGGAGIGSLVGGGTGGTGGSSSTTFNLTASRETDPVLGLPLRESPMSTGVTSWTGESVMAGAQFAKGGDNAANGTAIPAGMSFPWWLRAVGISAVATGGTLASDTSSGNKLAGGGGGGLQGAGGNAVASTGSGGTAASGTGYGSGGGGIATAGGTNTSGAGAPGCAVIMFELEV